MTKVATTHTAQDSSQQWDSKLYNTQHNYVTRYGVDVLDILSAKQGENILDLGCGTGALTASIDKICGNAVGIDSSVNMINEAKANFPDVQFLIANGHGFKFDYQFDAVFSNAALHWMLDAEKVIENVYQCLKPGGRFVFEMGGLGNIKDVLYAITTAAIEFKVSEMDAINYYPSLGEYSSLLEKAGFRVEYAATIDRPTELDGEDGLRNWVKMFRNNILEQIPMAEHEQYLSQVERIGRPTLYKNGIWMADYVRLRAIAKKIV